MLTSKKALILMGLLYFLATGFAGSVLFISVILISLGAVFIKTGFALNWFRAPSRPTVRAISVLGIICLIVQGMVRETCHLYSISIRPFLLCAFRESDAKNLRGFLCVLLVCLIEITCAEQKKSVWMLAL